MALDLLPPLPSPPPDAQVLGEDLVLVAGQQDRLLRGGNVWAHPVAYDKIAVRYRRWRNALERGDAAALRAAEAGLRPLSAGEVFSPEDSQDDWGDGAAATDASAAQ